MHKINTSTEHSENLDGNPIEKSKKYKRLTKREAEEIRMVAIGFCGLLAMTLLLGTDIVSLKKDVAMDNETLEETTDNDEENKEETTDNNDDEEAELRKSFAAYCEKHKDEGLTKETLAEDWRDEIENGVTDSDELYAESPEGEFEHFQQKDD